MISLRKQVRRITIGTLSLRMQTKAREINNLKPLRVRDIGTENGDQLEITFELAGKMRSFQRKKEESLGKTLTRMEKSILNPKKKEKKKTKEAVAALNHNNACDGALIELREKDLKTVVAPELDNEAAWISGRTFFINDYIYHVVKNPPSIKALHLPDNIMADYPIFPFVDFELATVANSVFKWYSSCVEQKQCGSTRPEVASEIKWNLAGDGFTFTPSISVIGQSIKVSCVPGTATDLSPFLYEAISKTVVSPGPGICPFERRQQYTQKRLSQPKQVRIVSYNILADIYASGEFARKVLFPYCPEYAIDYHYRRQLLLKELIGYNADLLCLQECDTKCYEGYLLPALKSEGFEGIFQKKGGETSEGEALFFQSSEFSLVENKSILLSEAIKMDYNSDISSHLNKIPALYEKFSTRKTVLQLVILQEKKSENYICIGNTHLYYKPNGGNIRLLQTAVILRHMESILSTFRESKDCKLSIILCGDLNSTPSTAAIDFLLQGHISAENNVWNAEEASERGFSLPLDHPFSFSSACGFPEFTNYVKGFRETLDYILVSSDIKVEAVVPFPSVEEIELHYALPSVVSPSDHLALICEIQL